MTRPFDPASVPAAVPASRARLEEENALLRAALAESRQRLATAEESEGLDPVTGLPAEPCLARALERQIGGVDRHGQPAALLTLDLDTLGQINEAHGRVAGDAALAHVAGLLKRFVRTSDLVTRNGSGFALLLDRLDPDSAAETGERLATLLAERPLDLGRALVPVAPRIVVTAILPGDEAPEVLARAGRNRERMKQF